MKNYKYLVIAAAATVFAACSDNENGVNDLTPIRLSSSLTVLETRAGTDVQTSQFLAGEKLDVFISEDVAAGAWGIRLHTESQLPSESSYTPKYNGYANTAAIRTVAEYAKPM